MKVTIDGKTFDSIDSYWQWKINTAKEEEREALTIHYFLVNIFNRSGLITKH
jgi:hypothetical protein